MIRIECDHCGFQFQDIPGMDQPMIPLVVEAVSTRQIPDMPSQAMQKMRRLHFCGADCAGHYWDNEAAKDDLLGPGGR